MMPATGYRPIGPGSGSVGSSGGSTGRTILTGNLNYYVSVTGSDSSNGLTLGNAFATVQHAMNVISSTLDLAGFFVVTNIGVGTFVGLGLKSSIGGGNILFIGAGRTSTFIGNGPNDGVYNFGECITAAVSVGATTIGIDALTLKPTTDNTPIYLGVFTLFCLGNNLTFPTPDIGFDCTNITAHNVIFAQAPVLIFDEGGAITVTGGNGTVISLINLQFAAVYESSASWSVSGNLTVTATVTVSGASQLLPITGAGSFTGAGVTGKRFAVGTGSVIGDADGTVGALGPTFFAGSSSGTCDTSSSYDGFQGPIPGINTQTGASYTHVLNDAYKTIEMNNAGANTFTVDTNANVPSEIGTKIWVTQIGAGATTIAGAVGVTVDNAGVVGGQWKTAKLYKRGTNEWVQTNA